MDLYGSQMTILCWFKADDFNLDDYRFISKASGIQADDHYWMLGTANNSGYPVLRMRLRTLFSTTTVNGSSGVLEAGVWTMASTTFDGMYIRLYKNADQVGLGMRMGDIAQDSMVKTWIGGNPDGDTSRPFHGTIDEVTIFSRALSASEIETLYKARQASVEVVKWEK